MWMFNIVYVVISSLGFRRVSGYFYLLGFIVVFFLYFVWVGFVLDFGGVVESWEFWSYILFFDVRVEI